MGTARGITSGKRNINEERVDHTLGNSPMVEGILDISVTYEQSTMRIIGTTKRELRKGPLCATLPHIGDIPGGYPVAIRSFNIIQREERSNSAQTGLPNITP